MGDLVSTIWTGGDLELRLAGDVDALAACQPDLERFCALHALAPMVANRLEVIFDEAASNAIRHGFVSGVGQSVRVRLAAEPGSVEMVFEDDGPPFNPLEKEERPRPKSLDEAIPGGLGIPLIRSMSAEVRYETPTAAADPTFNPVNRLTVVVARS